MPFCLVENTRFARIFGLRFFLFVMLFLGYEYGSAIYASGPVRTGQFGKDTTSVGLLLKKAKQMSSDGLPDSARIYYKRAGKIAREIGFNEGLFSYFSGYANFLYGQLDFNGALKISEEQLKLGQQLKDTKRVATAYNNIALQHHALGNLSSAAEFFLKAMKISENQDDPFNKRKYYTNLASVFIDLKDKKNSVFYAEKGYEIALKLKDSVQIARSLINLSASEELSGQRDLAIQHLHQIANFGKKLNEVYLEVHAYVNLGDIENRKKEYQSALDYYLKAEALLKSAPDQDYSMYVNYGLSNSYQNLGNYRKASAHFNKVIGEAETLMPKNDLQEVYMLGAIIREHLGQPAGALEMLKKYTALNDSLLNATTRKVIHETEIKYQTSLKEKAIAQQKLQLSKNQLELQQKNRWIWSSVIVILLLLAVCCIIYLIYRNKHQSVELSLLKAQIHPHFLFNTLNNLYALTLSKSDESPGVVLGLAEILRYILYECNTPSIDLKKEMHMIKRYIFLEKIRYRNRLEVNLNIEENNDGYEIAPLLLLPLVENAFKHGISKLVEEGWINIESRIKDNQFLFKISNNRVPGALRPTQPSKYGNIGLQNIKKRLNILYPDQHSLRIIEEDDVFVVILKVDLK
jgi:tetratricopeptide (TPR) repeat protein